MITKYQIAKALAKASRMSGRLCCLVGAVYIVLFSVLSPRDADGRLLINSEVAATTTTTTTTTSSTSTLLEGCILQLDFTIAGGTDQSGSGNDLTVDADHQAGDGGYYRFNGVSDEMTRGAKLTGAGAVNGLPWSFACWAYFVTGAAADEAVMSHNTTFATERSAVGHGNVARKIYAKGSSANVRGPNQKITTNIYNSSRK